MATNRSMVVQETIRGLLTSETSVTFVLCAAFPVKRETLEGQQMAMVQ